MVGLGIVGAFMLRLRNDLYCVERGVKLYSLTHSLAQSFIVCTGMTGLGECSFITGRGIVCVHSFIVGPGIVNTC